MTDTPNTNPPVDPNAPTTKSPVMWMALAFGTLAIITVISMWGKEKIAMVVSPTIPELGALEQQGRDIVNAQCIECHGVDGTGGTRKGPPLLHPMYRFDIYPDYHFKRVMKEGRPEHHWRFGPMPAQPQLSDAQTTSIIAYVRAVHDANGVE